MQNQHSFQHVFNPPFFLHKLYNYQKAIYERKGHWTEKEKVKYGVFLQVFRDKFQDKENPILNKMFRVMSDFIKTRNHNQCRSHHQKMERQRFEIDSILDSIRSKYHPRQYELFYEKYTKHIKTINIEVVLQQKGFTPHKNIQNRKKRVQKSKTEIQCKKQVEKQMDEQSMMKTNKVESIVEQMIHYQFRQPSIDNVCPYQKNVPVEINTTKPITSGKQQASLELLEPQNMVEKQIEATLQQEKEKNMKKTGLDYDEQDQNQNQKINVAYVQIPNQLKMQEQNQKNIFELKNFQTFAHERSLFQFMPSYQSSFGQNFSLNQNSMQQNYIVQIKQLQQQKQWHLNQANKYFTEMNDHIRRANVCQQSKQIISKNLLDIKRGYFFQNGFTTQF